MGTYANNMTIPELKRDILVYAKNNPDELIEIINDPLLEIQNDIREFLDKGFIAFRNSQRDVYYSLPNNKKKMLSVPFGEDPYSAITSFMQSNEGLEGYKFLQNRLKKD